MDVVIQRVVPDAVWPTDRSSAERGDPVDVRIVGGRIAEISPRIRPKPGDEQIDGRGGTVLPGFHDHHVHLRAWAAAKASVEAGPPDVRTADELAARLRQAPGGGSWVRAIGYHESVAGDIDRDWLDRLGLDRPVRIQHRGGALWVLNSRALAALDVDETTRPPGMGVDSAGRMTGRIWRGDPWLHARLVAIGAGQPPDLGPISRAAAAAGITGFTDATPEEDDDALIALAQAQQAGSILQRLHVMTGPSAAASVGRDGGGEQGAQGVLTRGPVKLLLDDARLPAFEPFVATMKDAHGRGRPVAVHCVTRTQAALTVAALAEAGSMPGDRIEHGAVLDADLLVALRTLGVTVVTQPGFVLARGDRYHLDVEPGDRDDLWRLGSLLEAGIKVAVGTDAPFGPDDPWLVVQAAASRRTADGRQLGPTEGITPRRAASLFCGRPESPGTPRAVAPGEIADLMVLAGTLDDTLSGEPPTVLATIVDGTVVHRAEP